MIIVATSESDAYRAREWLEGNGFVFKYSLFWSEEWQKDDKSIFLHKGYHKGRTNYEWEGYMR